MYYKSNFRRSNDNKTKTVKRLILQNLQVADLYSKTTYYCILWAVETGLKIGVTWGGQVGQMPSPYYFF